MSKASMVFLLILVAGVFIRYNHGKPRTFLMETVDTEDNTDDNTMDPKDNDYNIWMQILSICPYCLAMSWKWNNVECKNVVWINKLGLSWAKLSSSWDWALLHIVLRPTFHFAKLSSSWQVQYQSDWELRLVLISVWHHPTHPPGQVYLSQFYTT